MVGVLQRATTQALLEGLVGVDAATGGFIKDSEAGAFGLTTLGAANETAFKALITTMQNVPRSTTAALEAVANAINTTGKFANKVVINTTAGTIVTAADGTAGGVWQALDGTTAHTPV